MNDGLGWEAQAKRIREEINEISQRADALERILPNIIDPEEKRKLEQLIESYRLHANRLSEHIRDVPPV